MSYKKFVVNELKELLLLIIISSILLSLSILGISLLSKLQQNFNILDLILVIFIGIIYVFITYYIIISVHNSFAKTMFISINQKERPTIFEAILISVLTIIILVLGIGLMFGSILLTLKTIIFFNNVTLLSFLIIILLFFVLFINQNLVKSAVSPKINYYGKLDEAFHKGKISKLQYAILFVSILGLSFSTTGSTYPSINIFSKIIIIILIILILCEIFRKKQ